MSGLNRHLALPPACTDSIIIRTMLFRIFIRKIIVVMSEQISAQMALSSTTRFMAKILSIFNRQNRISADQKILIAGFSLPRRSPLLRRRSPVSFATAVVIHIVMLAVRFTALQHVHFGFHPYLHGLRRWQARVPPTPSNIVRRKLKLQLYLLRRWRVSYASIVITVVIRIVRPAVGLTVLRLVSFKSIRPLVRHFPQTSLPR